MFGFELAAEYIEKNDITGFRELIRDNLSLLEKKNSFGSLSLLHLATEKDRVDIVRFLLEQGVDPDIRDETDKTVLHYAIKKSSYETIRLLLDYGTDINAVDSLGWTPLFYAIETNRKDIVELLLKRGADVNWQDTFSQTALHISFIGKNLSIAKLLILYNADPFMKDFEDRTPLDYLEDERLKNEFLFIYHNREKILKEMNRQREVKDSPFHH